MADCHRADQRFHSPRQAEGLSNQENNTNKWKAKENKLKRIKNGDEADTKFNKCDDISIQEVNNKKHFGLERVNTKKVTVNETLR